MTAAQPIPTCRANPSTVQGRSVHAANVDSSNRSSVARRNLLGLLRQPSADMPMMHLARLVAYRKTVCRQWSADGRSNACLPPSAASGRRSVVRSYRRSRCLLSLQALDESLGKRRSENRYPTCPMRWVHLLVLMRIIFHTHAICSLARRSPVVIPSRT